MNDYFMRVLRESENIRRSEARRELQERLTLMRAERLSNESETSPSVTTPGDPDAGAYEAVSPRSELLWAAVDLDGTIAEPIWTPENPTSEIGAPIEENVDKLFELVENGYKIVIHTSRPWTDYEAIEGWLNYYNIPFRSIVCGKLLAKIYIDDRARWSEATSWLPPKDLVQGSELRAGKDF